VLARQVRKNICLYCLQDLIGYWNKRQNESP
jgi:hypothetical protein